MRQSPKMSRPPGAGAAILRGSRTPVVTLVLAGLLLAGCTDAQDVYPDSYQGEAVAVEGARVGSMEEPAVESLVALLEMDGNPGAVDMEALCGQSGCPAPRPLSAHGTILVRDDGGIAAVVLAMEHTDAEEATAAIQGRETSEGVQAVMRDGNIVVSVQVDEEVPELLDRILDALEERTGAERAAQ